MSYKGGDEYYWSEEAVTALIEATAGMREVSRIMFVTRWIEDNCEVKEDLNYMVDDLIGKIKGL